MMEPVEVGEIRIDLKAREEAMKVDRKKVWKHRVGVVLDELGVNMISVPVASYLALIIAAAYFYGPHKTASPIPFFSIILGPMLLYGFICLLSNRFKAISSRWNP